jgi:8-oxo-dGTP pyrophosphatase MutT (NUDIX family)
MTEVTRHFTATTFIVHDRDVLLHLHPKQKLWLPPGGHIERDELPHVAAVREVEEETGLRVRLHSEAQSAQLAVRMDCGVIPQPAFILIEDINPFHQHLDFVYFATIPDTDRWCQGRNATWQRSGFDWFDAIKLESDEVPTNVRVGARLAVDHFVKRRGCADTMSE